jgi:SPP1 family predicted phage head-tail adaptor|tara:strand:- start:2359 stop:2679 length:321 start_codon:yes stop_codon:yes gene_type:complete
MIGGRLDRRIVIQSVSSNRGTDGFGVLTWSTHLSCWAMKVHEDGKESTDNNDRSTSRMVKFRTRYHPTVTNQMRIKWNSEWYKIEDIKELGRQDGLMIFTTLLQQT